MSNNGKFLNLENGKKTLEEALESSSGASDSSSLLKTNSLGLVDPSFLEDTYTRYKVFLGEELFIRDGRNMVSAGTILNDGLIVNDGILVVL